MHGAGAKALCKNAEMSIPCRMPVTREVRNIAIAFPCDDNWRGRETSRALSIISLHPKPAKMCVVFTQALRCNL
jgi:hypothetical protein